MDNPVKQATLDTQDTGRRQTKQKHRTKTNKTKTQDEDRQNKNTAQKTRKMSNTPVHVSYKTPVVLLIYTVKSSKFVDILQLKES